jgi:hypothetical protein
MTPSNYSEGILVEQPGIERFGSLGWETRNYFHEFDHGPSPLGRETKAEVVLTQRLRPARSATRLSWTA